MPLIQCPDCERDISDAAPSCIHCGRPMHAPTPARPVDPRARSGYVETKQGGEFLRVLGWLGIVAGIIGLFSTAAMDTTVETGSSGFGLYSVPSQRVHNIGLMNEKQNRLIIFGFVLLGGIASLGIGYGVRETVRLPVATGQNARASGGKLNEGQRAQASLTCYTCGISIQPSEARDFNGVWMCREHYAKAIL